MPDTRLVLAGDGPLRPELTRLCVERGIAGQVEFRGTLSSDELRTAMDTADSFVLTSDVETFGVVVIEAQAAALPCIVTASGGPDHLIDASNGLLVPVGDVRMLRAALIDMRNTAARYDRAAIRAFAIDRYGAETFAKQFDRLTADVM